MQPKINQDDLGPKLIFDSRIARVNYGDDYLNWRSSDVDVPPGYIGLVEMIGPVEYMQQVQFTAIRRPIPPIGEDGECYKDCGIGKRYRRWRCQQSLGNQEGNNGTTTTYTSYNSNIVYWGKNPFTGDIVEFEYIVRPGRYYIECNACLNSDILDDCVNPVIFEFSLIPSTMPQTDLILPCNPKLAEYYYDAPEDATVAALEDIADAISAQE